jgi:hypothetical protein
LLLRELFGFKGILFSFDRLHILIFLVLLFFVTELPHSISFSLILKLNKLLFFIKPLLSSNLFMGHSILLRDLKRVF